MPSLFRSRYLGRNGQADYERLNIAWNQNTWVDNAYILWYYSPFSSVGCVLLTISTIRNNFSVVNLLESD